MKDRTIYIVQFITLSFVWILAVSITWWFIHLVIVASELKDAQTASISISILAVTIFWILAGVLSYVFFGLHRNAKAGA
ncbi:MAG: hypothetical protein M1470_03940 [Bacteroidetes bacterium]|nr:hypothetical protein [Bacteroidota bacterium]MCL5738785.1 hypothetical protein [Bacteroidota bacterium]